MMKDENSPDQKRQKTPWYLNKSSMVIGFLVIGPVSVLPAIWAHPRMGRSVKIFWTTIVIAATVFLFKITLDQLKHLNKVLEMMTQQL